MHSTCEIVADPTVPVSSVRRSRVVIGAMLGRSTRSCAWAGLLIGICFSSLAVAQPGRDKEELSWDRNISQLFRRYCYSCHGMDAPSGNVNLAQDADPAQILRHQRTWATAVHVLQSDEMPPEDQRQPLWSRPPDAELLTVAASGRLHEPEQLREQTMRMLGDDRNRALVDNFFAQWLDLRRLQSHQPDPESFAEFDDALRQAMIDEANLILLEIISEDRPLTWLIDSDHTYANARLAEHYGLTEVTSSTPVRVQLTDRRRGGLVSSAALLMLQSDSSRNNIPRRGNFIAGQWLGSPPPPPPPDVPPLSEAEDGRPRSMRETFELHRSHPNCQSCHTKIDPLGFSLENFDAVGRWRDTEFGLPIDASAELTSGEQLDGIVGLKDFLLANREVVLEQLANRLLIYALGRGLEASDQCVVERMVAAGRQADYRFSALVLELVTSIPFTHRQNPEY